MDVKNVLISAGVALLAVVLGLAFLGQPSVQVIKETVEKLGAFPGPSITGDYLSVGGIAAYYRSGSCNDATSTLFTIQNPFRATSTWTYAEVEVTKAATSSATIFGSYGISVATSTVTGPASSTIGLIQSAPFANATIGSVRSGTTFATSTQFAAFQSLFKAGTGTSSGTTTLAIVMGPDEYVIGYATGTLNAIMDVGNEFACKWGLKFERLE